jgi:hypothetical protein
MSRPSEDGLGQATPGNGMTEQSRGNPIARPPVQTQREIKAMTHAQFIEQLADEILSDEAKAAFGRPLRSDLTPQELFRLEEYGSIHFDSAGATRKR